MNCTFVHTQRTRKVPVLEELKEQVAMANLELVERGLVMQTFGNVSGVDRKRGLMVIKPSGVNYAGMGPEHMVVVSLAAGEVVEGDLNPSSDTPTHLVLYRAFHSIGGIAHTHSLYATSWAQAQCEIPALGTTHADYCNGPVPCTRMMTPHEIETGYEANTGQVIVERFNGLEASSAPGTLVASHGPFAWGATAAAAVDNAEILEYMARLASETLHIRREMRPMQDELLRKHFLRKHGSDAYYGQKRAGVHSLTRGSRLPAAR
jgi:L-ribulose-5-phosphate 4-epimerase